MAPAHTVISPAAAHFPSLSIADTISRTPSQAHVRSLSHRLGACPSPLQGLQRLYAFVVDCPELQPQRIYSVVCLITVPKHKGFGPKAPPRGHVRHRRKRPVVRGILEYLWRLHILLSLGQCGAGGCLQHLQSCRGTVVARGRGR